MATCSNYNCDSLTDHEVSNESCLGPRNGGSAQLIIFDCGITVTDPTDGTEINNLINAGSAYLVENVKAGLDAPSPVTIPSVTSCGSDRVINLDYTGTIEDYTVTETNTSAFWGPLAKGRTMGAMMLYLCEQDGYANKIVWIDAEISFSGGLVVPNVNTEAIRYELSFAFRKNGPVEFLDAPTGVFS